MLSHLLVVLRTRCFVDQLVSSHGRAPAAGTAAGAVVFMDMTFPQCKKRETLSCQTATLVARYNSWSLIVNRKFGRGFEVYSRAGILHSFVLLLNLIDHSIQPWRFCCCLLANTKNITSSCCGPFVHIRNKLVGDLLLTDSTPAQCSIEVQHVALCWRTPTLTHAHCLRC